MRHHGSRALASVIALAASLAARGALAQDAECHSVPAPPGSGYSTVLHCDEPNRALVALRWATAGTSVAVLSAGVVFQVLALNDTARIEAATSRVDPMTGLPLIRYSEVESTERSRALNQGLAIGMFAGGVSLAVASVVLFAVPATRSSSRDRASFGVSPFGGHFALRF